MKDFASVLLRNFHIADSRSPWNGDRCDLLIENGVIASISPAGSALPPSAEQVVDGQGAYVSPGWCDSLAYLSDPGKEWKETIAQFAEAALAGGFTDVLCYAGGGAPPDQASALEALRAYAHGLPVDLWFCGEASVGGMGKDMAELYDLRRAGALAFTDGVYHPIQDPSLLIRLLQYLQPFDGRLFHYPYTVALQGDGIMNEGVTATLLGFKGAPELAEFAAGGLALDALAYAGGRLHFQPLSSPTLIKRIAEAKAAGLQATTAVSALHLGLQDGLLDSFDTHLKIIPPLRSAEQVQALCACIIGGQVDALCSLHHAQGLEEKSVEFSLAEPGMLNLQTAFSVAYQRLCQTGPLRLDQLVDLWTHGPRAILGLPPVEVTAGSPARLTLFDPQQTMQLQKESIPSRAKNSWFIGKALPVKVLGVVRGLRARFFPS